MSKRNILVISAHPDDEALGCGGTLLKHKDEGASIHWLIVTGMKPEFGYAQADCTRREGEIQKVKELLSIENLIQLDKKPASLDSSSIGELVGHFTETYKKCNPDTVYCVNHSDAHSDHRIVFEAASVLTKGFRYPSVKNFSMYECLSETEFAVPLTGKTFVPNMYVDISKQFARKKDFINIYASEMAQHPFPRSLTNVEALALLRGSMIGASHAEAFQLLKLVI